MNSGQFNDSIKNEIVTNIEADFREAKMGIENLPGKSKLAVYIAYSFYQHLLKKLKNTPAEIIITKRIRLTGTVKIVLLIKSYLQYILGII
jgi:phytoene/squalene synthetase